ncbi:MAG: hypothetical protein NW200_14780 [Hyphomonadaceae bacterium]|nr:hypothetical protein [Hyphomonadaceae bacterium]
MSARRLHRRLAWIAGAVALAWAATGFLHPIMSWTAPRAAVQAPPPHDAPLDGVIAPGPSLAAAGLEDVTFVRLMPTPGGAAWLAEDAAGRRIAVDARTGAPAGEAERAHAVTLARHYSGLEETPIAEAVRVESFSTRYPSVNRILPIWEVRLDTPDGLTVYVDTKTDRLATVTNDQRRILLSVFQNVHTLKFLEGVEVVRIVAMLALVGGVLATTALGLAMLATGRGRGVRGAHRALAWVTAPLVIGFAASGLFHLVVTSSLSAPPAPKAGSFPTADLAGLPRVTVAGRIDLTATRGGEGRAVWRVAGADGGLYFDGAGRLLALDDAARARQIAGRDGPVRTVKSFDDEYGFINKRLPVIGVGQGPGAVFADVREGLVAGRAAPGVAGVEGWVFDVIHKWEPVAGWIGRRNRDYLTMLAVALIGVMALLGLALATRRSPRN